MVDLFSIVIAVLLAVVIALQLVALFRSHVEGSREGLGPLTHELRTEITASRKEARESAQAQRTELSGGLNQFSQTLQQQMASIASIQGNQIDSFARQLAKLVESNEQRLKEVRATLDEKLKELQNENTLKLEEMRKTVDEKLHATLEKRLGESFKQVSDRLEQVHKGLGEMQTLAVGVGDLKRVLTNVKSRGTWGEVQLGTLLEQTLAPEQYAVNVATLPGSSERVEFAIRLPGRSGGKPIWLPTGPNNLAALLNALQMGFRTLAIEKRSSEVWELLSAVKTEFGKFGEILANTKRQLETVTRSIGQAETRTRQMARTLTDVEALPEPKVAKLLGEPDATEEDDAAA